MTRGPRRVRPGLAAALSCLLAACTPGERTEVSRPAPVEPPALLAADWPDLPGWTADRAAEWLPALLAQCARRPTPGEATTTVPADRLADAEWWRATCAQAASLRPRSESAVRGFLETRFQPVAIDAAGLLTGYFEPIYPACAEKQPTCPSPVRARPPGLVDVDARRIDPAGPARRIRGCVDRGALSACPDRAAIEAGGLSEAPVLAWMDPVDKFFLQIQGSGRLALPDGGTLRLGYEAQNGAPYVPIGRVLLDRGDLSRPVSMQSIRAWLASHRDQAEAVLNANPSYVFFRPLDLPASAGPLGAMGVPLTTHRSVAVDPRFVPLGLPVYVAADGVTPRLAQAQDVGGAIRGPVRLDLFTGTGEAAGEVAGRLVAPARAWLLLPLLGPRLGDAAPAR